MRKKRIRQDIIEDLGFNYVERQVLLAGFTLRRYYQNEDGYDGVIHTFDELGDIENDLIHIQLKSIDTTRLSKNKKSIVFDLSKHDLELWLLSSNYLIIVIYDAQKEAAYYLDLESYFRENGIALRNVRKVIHINCPLDNLFSTAFVKELRLKNINHHADS